MSLTKEIILQGKIATVLHFEERLHDVTKLLADLWEATKMEDLEILSSIERVGVKTAPPFLAETGKVQNFASFSTIH